MEKNMKGLTKQELETLMESENIIFSHIALHKAVETYVKSDIIALNNLYSEKVGE